VVSINYRYIRQAEAEGVKPPVIGPLNEAARALQFVRSKAAGWKLDKTRVGAFGGSAGGASSPWLALHSDLADPNSSDPIARESTRLTCAAVLQAQTTLDPQQVVSWIPNTVGYGAHAFGIKQDRARKLSMLQAYITDREKHLPWIAEYSPDARVSQDDPPLMLHYRRAPEPPGQPVKDTSHTANYGVKFAERCQEVGMDCLFLHPDVTELKDHSVEKYLIQKLSHGTDSK
jgi:acetyl esterase/lipase